MLYARRKLRSLKQVYFAASRALKNATAMGTALNPILVFGYQKSGTSAIASVLAHATAKSVTIDIFHKMGDLELKILEGRASFADVLRSGACYFRADIVKEPEFVLFMSELTEAFPDSRKVFIVRDPFENIRSILNRLKLQGNRADLSPQDIARIRLEFPLWMPVITDLFSTCKGGTYIERLAARWQFAANQYFASPDNFVLARYEDFLQDKPGFISRLAESLGLIPIVNIETVANKQFQPRGKRVCPLEFFGKDNCDLILTRCEETSRKFGYSRPVVMERTT